MNNSSMLSEAYDFVLKCGNVHKPKMFAQEIVTRLSDIVPFDQARIYYFNGNGKVSDQYAQGIEKKWIALYHEYYSKLEDGRYAIPINVHEKQCIARAIGCIGIRNWMYEPDTEFKLDYVRPIGIRHSLGFILFDIDGWGKTHFTLDRTSNCEFEQHEIDFVKLVYPHLNNLHKNFFLGPTESTVRNSMIYDWNMDGLTEREKEVLYLLCQGFTTQDISRKLNISFATVRKHSEHIYKKMHVSNRQELLVRCLK